MYLIIFKQKTTYLVSGFFVYLSIRLIIVLSLN